VEGEGESGLAHLKTTVGPLAQTIAAAPKTTIRPARDTAGSRAKQAVDALVADSGASSHGAVDLEGTLGEGGMGIVRLATQRSMGRKVAVKTARVEKRSDAATVKLLREAWLTGALEHPNVLPVYDVGIDGDGAPVIVMRLVDGTDWAQLIAEPATVRERFGAEELLEWNLRVLMQVCNAVRFAHSRGIIHRDLKPENVMVGQFGEVYVLDWGIAVSLGDDGDGRFPLASSTDQMVGTPAYMAPEMLAARGEALSERTDVYLLGAILFEIVEGEPPHDCDSIERFVDSVVNSSPRFRREVPEELERICRRAMGKTPEDRFETVEELRLAVEGFLRHRGSARLAHEATERLGALREALVHEGEDADAQRLLVHNLFSECRFGFQEALAQWSDNRAAREGLREAIVEMARFELAGGDHRAAALLLRDLDAPPADLVQSIEEAQRASEDERREFEQLRKMEREHDPRFGQRTRWFLLGGFAAVWAIIPFFLARGSQPDHFRILLFPLGFLAMSAVLFAWARESLTKTAFNRRASLSIFFTFVAQAIVVLGAQLGGIPVTTVLPMEFFLWFVIAGMLTITLDNRFWPVALGYLLAFFAVAYFKSNSGDLYFRHGMYAMSAAHACLAITVFVVWRPATIFRKSAGEERSG
jgi:serine/threonine-protein kinase